MYVIPVHHRVHILYEGPGARINSDSAVRYTCAGEAACIYTRSPIPRADTPRAGLASHACSPRLASFRPSRSPTRTCAHVDDPRPLRMSSTTVATTTTDVAHPFAGFRFPPPALSTPYYGSPAEDAYAYLHAALAVPSGAGFFDAEADMRARDVIDVRWSWSNAEDVDADAVVSALGLYCLVCGGTWHDDWIAGEDECSRTTPEQKWSNDTVLLPAQGWGLRYTVPEIGKVGTACACAFVLESESTGGSSGEKALSQAFSVRNIPRGGRRNYASAANFVYNTTYPAGTVFSKEEQTGGQDSHSIAVEVTEHSPQIRREQPLASEAALEDVEREKRRRRASIGIITGAVLAAFLFAFILWKRCPSCRQDSNTSSRLGDPEQGPRGHDADEDGEQNGEKPPPAYHEVVTRQERMAMRYEMQRMNAPLPDYTPAVPTTASGPIRSPEV
jgi:hypothetical protein